MSTRFALSSSHSSRVSSAAVIRVSPHAPPGSRWVCVIPAWARKRRNQLRPVSAHSADAALLSDRVIIAQASARSVRVSDRCSA